MSIKKFALPVLFATLATGASAQPQQKLSDVDIMLIKQAATELEYTYAAGMDTESPDIFASAFSPNARMVVRRGVYRGENDGMRKYLIGRNERKKAVGAYRTTHAVVNVRVQVQDRDHAKGEGWEIQYDYNPKQPETVSLEPILVGRFETSYIRTPRGWKIAERELKDVVQTPHETAVRDKARGLEKK